MKGAGLRHVQSCFAIKQLFLFKALVNEGFTPKQCCLRLTK
jgi:hypothetical protein